MRVAFHHHVATHVETPEEVDRFLGSFSPRDLGLCLDTGHSVYGGGDPAQLLERYGERIRCVHPEEDCSFNGWMVVEQDVLAGGAGAANPFVNAVAGREVLRTLDY